MYVLQNTFLNATGTVEVLRVKHALKCVEMIHPSVMSLMLGFGRPQVVTSRDVLVLSWWAGCSGCQVVRSDTVYIVFAGKRYWGWISVTQMCEMYSTCMEIRIIVYSKRIQPDCCSEGCLSCRSLDNTCVSQDDPSRDEFTMPNTKTCLHFLTFLNIEMVQFVEVFPRWRQWHVYPASLIPSILSWLGVIKSHNSSHGVDLVLQEFSGFSTRRITTELHSIMQKSAKCPRW